MLSNLRTNLRRNLGGQDQVLIPAQDPEHQISAGKDHGHQEGEEVEVDLEDAPLGGAPDPALVDVAAGEGGRLRREIEVHADVEVVPHDGGVAHLLVGAGVLRPAGEGVLHQGDAGALHHVGVGRLLAGGHPLLGGGGARLHLDAGAEMLKDAEALQKGCHLPRLHRLGLDRGVPAPLAQNLRRQNPELGRIGRYLEQMRQRVILHQISHQYRKDGTTEQEMRAQTPRQTRNL